MSKLWFEGLVRSLFRVTWCSYNTVSNEDVKHCNQYAIKTRSMLEQRFDWWSLKCTVGNQRTFIIACDWFYSKNASWPFKKERWNMEQFWFNIKIDVVYHSLRTLESSTVHHKRRSWFALFYSGMITNLRVWASASESRYLDPSGAHKLANNCNNARSWECGGARPCHTLAAEYACWVSWLTISKNSLSITIRMWKHELNLWGYGELFMTQLS